MIKTAGNSDDNLAVELEALRRRVAHLDHLEEQNRQLQAELRFNRLQLQSILDNSTAIIWMRDLDGRFLLINHFCEEFFRLDRKDVIGRNLREIVPAELFEEWERQDRQVVEAGQALEWEEELTVTDQTIRFKTRKFPLLDEQGRPYALLGIARNVTLSHQTELALAEEKERQKVILQSIGEGVITTDLQGYIVSLNPAAEQLTGWSRQEAIGLPLTRVFDVYTEDSRQKIIDTVSTALQKGNALSFSTNKVLVTREGQQRIVSQTAAPVQTATNPPVPLGIVLVFRDITEKHRMEQEMIKLQRLETVALLAGGIAHDFNNILTAAIGYLSLARTGYDEKTELLTEAETALLKARGLSQQLLTFALETKPDRKITSIGPVVEEASRFALRGSKVVGKFQLSGELWPVEIDAGQITQVIHNLVLNAVQAMPGGGRLSVTGRNIVTWQRRLERSQVRLKQLDYILIGVSDNGPGIAPEILPRIFDPYFTTKADGTGLGLATCYSIVSKHDGYLTVSSEAGKGTTFYMYLPASPEQSLASPQSPADLRPEPVPALTPAATPLRPTRILVVDDEQQIVMLLKRALTASGYEVSAAQNSAEAVELYRQSLEQADPFRLVIIDLTLPGEKGGKETMQELLLLNPAVVGLLTSGYSTDPAVTNPREYGFAGSIVKPFLIKDLLETIRQILE